MKITVKARSKYSCKACGLTRASVPPAWSWRLENLYLTYFRRYGKGKRSFNYGNSFCRWNYKCTYCKISCKPSGFQPDLFPLYCRHRLGKKRTWNKMGSWNGNLAVHSSMALCIHCSLNLRLDFPSVMDHNV